MWTYVSRYQSDTLPELSNLSLLPCLLSGCWEDDTWKYGEIQLHTMNELFLLRSFNGMDTLSNSVCQAIKHLSVNILPSLPSWLDTRNLSCIYFPTESSILQLLEKLQLSGSVSIAQFNDYCAVEDRHALATFIARSRQSLSCHVTSLLQKLCMFVQKNTFNEASTKFTCIAALQCMANFIQDFPVRFPRPMLVSSFDNCMHLAKALGATVIDEEQMILDVMTDINKNCYTALEVTKFMKWFLARIAKYKSNGSVMHQARKIAFVPNGIGMYKPSDLYDPRDANLAILFAEENKFPSEDFRSDIYLNAMHSLGLKRKQDITPDCVYLTAKLLDHLCKCNQDAPYISEKANAFFTLLEENVNFLSAHVTETRRQLHVSIKHLNCIQHERNKPVAYPNTLPWKGTEFFLCTPADLKSITFVNTAGSVSPLIRFKPSKLSEHFHWSESPGAETLTKQLENILGVYTSLNKPALLPFISDVFRAMAEKESEIVHDVMFRKLLQSNCIWWGDGFCCPDDLVLESQGNDVDLKPYKYVIPSELQSVRTFLERIGCHTNQTVRVLLSVLEMIATKHTDYDAGRVDDVQKDLNIVLQILSKLYQEQCDLDSFGDKVLFPVHTGDDTRLLLKPYTQCTFCDAQWLKDITEEVAEDIIYVHGDVPATLAEGLGVKSLRNQLMSDAEGIEEWGQEEPLTRRLHNILKDGYVDGLSVPKEILQNADDARASKMYFLYDERENFDARTQLLDEGMTDCQGPALWAYNDAMFSEADLKNITKLSGATKETDTSKIGKFGLGFCAVYNLTDVPSLVSGKNVVIFDPHMKYLNKALPAKSPGLRINLQSVRNRRLMNRMNNQFKPYQGIFDCDLSNKEPFFDGTLFRLPLRTSQQAATSRIKNTSYSKEEMIALLKQFVEASGNLLLFTQHVAEIKLFHIPAFADTPPKARLLCRVLKENVFDNLSKSMLAICSDMKQNNILRTRPFENIQKLIITVACEEEISFLSSLRAGISKTCWLISWKTGTSKSLELCYSTSITGALPIGSVAMLVGMESDCLTPRFLTDAPFGFYNTGHVFCYLPLPIKTQLNVHLNGSFAVASNRRSLLTNTEDDKKYSYDTQWNEALLSDAVAQALINLLVFVHSHGNGEYNTLCPKYNFYDFWPTRSDQMRLCLNEGFYKNVILSNSLVFKSCNKWLGLRSCIFLSPEVAQTSDIRAIVLSTLHQFRPNAEYGVVNLPALYFNELQRITGWKEKAFIVNEEDFFLDYLLPNIESNYWCESERNLEDRNKLLLYCLEHTTSKIDEHLKGICCVPTCPEGKLRKPHDLVHPYSKVASLFSKVDGRFPDNPLRTDTALGRLVTLGMMVDTLEPNIVIERAESVSKLALTEGKHRAVTRCRYLLQYLASYDRTQGDLMRDLKGVAFLPVLEKPQTWPFKWRAEKTSKGVGQDQEPLWFDRAEHLFMLECKNLVGCGQFILDYDAVSDFSRRLPVLFNELGVKTTDHVKIETVIDQLLAVCKETGTTTKRYSKMIDDVFDSIYMFLNKAVLNTPELAKPLLLPLQGEPVVRLGAELLPSNRLAFLVGYNCSPELYEIGQHPISRYGNFLEAIGVPKQVDITFVAEILKKKKEYFQETVLPFDEFQLTNRLLLLLYDLMVQSNMNYEDLTNLENIVAADTSMILRPTHTLCFDDCDFFEATSSMKYIHGDIPRTVAEKLGVYTKRRKHVEDCSMEIPFEQKEELVTRLRRLLDGYPCDIGILKELIQNADDANATEVYFLLDLRTHGCDKIFEETFKEFQGPALCVFNDSSFTQKDLIGIQKLGIGSKAEDPAKTGQYGVGFNAVYNLTDLPSFLTKGPEIEGGETLCIFDPLHKHLKKRIGTRFVNMQAIRVSYPDVISGYNEGTFFANRNVGTVFRFPLRKSESDISGNVVSTKDLETLFIDFKKELNEMLLFLKSVTRITIATVSSECLGTERIACASLDDYDRQQRNSFTKLCQTYARGIRNQECTIEDIKPFLVSYKLHVKDNLEQEEIWFIVQKIGLAEQNLPQCLVTAIKKGNIGLLPVGGIAVRLPKLERKRSTNVGLHELVKKFDGRPKPFGEGRAFSFLPLPGSTGLPMNVNGHFILDHEARRGLWKEECRDEFKSDWNRILLSDIVAAAYVEALTYIKCNIIFPYESLQYSEREVLENLMIFDRYIPLAKDASNRNWKYLVYSVLQTVVSRDIHLFPVVLKHVDQEHGYKFEVSWKSVLQRGYTFPLYFTKSDIRESIKDPFLDLLRRLGMKITSVSHCFQQSLMDSKIDIDILSPSAVIGFFKSFATTAVDKVKISAIPCMRQETEFRSIQSINQVLLFCSSCDNFQNAINGLPLLVTNDDHLRCFDETKKVFCTNYSALFPQSSDRFVHVQQMTTLDVSLKDKVKNVVKDFHITHFAELLPNELDSYQFTRLDEVVWNSDVPREEWIHEVWEFLKNDFDIKTKQDSHITFENFLSPLQNWCIIPALKGDSFRILVKVSKAYSILNIESFIPISPLENALRRLELPVLNCQLLSTQAVLLLSTCVAQANSPVSFLVCLMYYREFIGKKTISSADCFSILGYFSDNLKVMKQSRNAEPSWIAKSLRSLPLFVTKEENRVALTSQDTRVIVLPNGIPKIGLDQWANSTRTILLKNEYRLKQLYEFLGFTYTERIDVYLKHFLNTWDFFPDVAVIDHLKYIKDTLLISSKDEYNIKQRSMIQCLKNIALIAEENGRKKVQNYYSPHQPVFKVMCKKEEFPPEALCSSEWRRFLELIGIKNEVPGALFLRFAKEVATEGHLRITADCSNKSEILVNHLFRHKIDWEPSIYRDISLVKFVVPYKVDIKYSKVHPQYCHPDSFVCFQDSISCKFSQQVWTSLALLPVWEDTKETCNQNNQKKLEQLLGIHYEPPVDSIIKHCQNVCDSLMKLFKDKTAVALSEYCWIEDLMENLYKHLYKKDLSSSECKEKLYHTPVIYNPELHLFAPAHQVVEDLSPDQEIQPYLLKAPVRYGKYFPLFRYLGAEKSPSVFHYIKVLAKIKEEVNDNELKEEYPSDWGVIRKALDNLVLCLKPTNAEESQIVPDKVPKAMVLYLPTRRKHMSDASLIIIPDNSHFYHRLSEVKNVTYFIGFKALHLQHSMGCFRRLPKSLQPKFLSDIVKEEVDTSQMVEIPDSITAINIETFLQTDDFIRGILRLVKHFKNKHQLQVLNKELEQIVLRIQTTKVRQVTGLKTYLLLNGKRIDSSAESNNGFVPEPGKHKSDVQMCIYFQSTNEPEIELIDSIDEHLIKYVNYITACTIPDARFIMKLFKKISDPTTISLMLDRMHIRPYDLPDEVIGSVFPKPGTYVPVKLHHLLNCDFSDFKPQDYLSVALELEDASILDIDDITDSYTPVYIYVRIEKKITSGNEPSVVNQKYEVFTGSEIVTVPAFKIYKFIRQKTCYYATDLVDTGVIPQAGQDQYVSKTKYSIRCALEEAWKMPEDDRRHIIKRLYLKWHPDKNIGNEEFCADIFGYIKQVIFKLENGIPLDDIDETDGQMRAYPDFTSSRYFRFCERMNSRSHSHRAYAQEPFYHRPGTAANKGASGRGGAAYGTSFAHRDSSKQKYEDRGEAARWQRQAKVDLRNAFETINVQGEPPAFNWICYMCHQVIISTISMWFIIWAGPREKVPSSMCKMCGFTSSCTFSKSHPVISSPSKHSIISSDYFMDSEGPDQTARMCKLIWAFVSRICPKICFRRALPIQFEV